MKNHTLQKFFIGIVLPAILAILLFFFSVWLIIVPIAERNMMESKKAMINELTHTAWSLIDEYYQDYCDSIYTLEEAQNLAASRVGKMRYGDESKDYFWITDMQPVMILHPYRTDLNNQDLSHYTDPNGMKLFVEAAKLVEYSNEGYIYYSWQWKDDTARIVPKLSYVKGFSEWGWIVGTGIYIEDIRNDISALKKQIIQTTLLILLLIAILLFFIIRKSLRIEQSRKLAEDMLIRSREKYKTLVEASSEGTLMLNDNSMVYCNEKLCKLSGYDNMEVSEMNFESLFTDTWDNVSNMFKEPGKSISIETKLKLKSGEQKEIVLSLSKTSTGSGTQLIITTKEIDIKHRLIKANKRVDEQLQAEIAITNQPIGNLIKEGILCDAGDTLQEASALMTQKQKDCILVSHNGIVIGVVTEHDIVHRAIALNLPLDQTVGTIMSAPVISIDGHALLPQAMIKFKNNNVSHLLIKNYNNIEFGIVGKEALWEIYDNSIFHILEGISSCIEFGQLKDWFDQIPAMVNVLIESGTKVESITRLISNSIDEITKRSIELGIKSLGPAPCKFAFIAMGSEGRFEQTLSTDQDNAIIYENEFANKAEVKEYFLGLAEKVNQSLHNAGINYCSGDVMAKNEKWNQSLDKWKEYFKTWIHNSDPTSLLEAAIFFDFRLIYGEEDFTIELREFVNNEVKNKAVFFQHLAQNIIKYKVTSPGANSIVDIKKLLFPITGIARLYYLQNTGEDLHTLHRLERIKDKNIIPAKGIEELKDVYNYLTYLRLSNQSEQIQLGKTPSNEYETSSMSEFKLESLKKAASVIREYQSLLSADFKGMV